VDAPASSIVPGPTDSRTRAFHPDSEIVEIAVDVFGETVRVRAAVAPGRARLADVVPLARELAGRVVAATIRRIRADGGDVPCRRGCADCCASYLVPVSVPEAVRLGDEIGSLPPGMRRRVAAAMLSAARRIIRAGAPSLPGTLITHGGGTIACPAGAVGQWYAGLNIGCPLLEGDACQIYAHRPLACAEHMVTTSPEFCRGFQPGRGRIAALPVSVLEALAKLAAEVEQRPVESTLVPLLPAWNDLNAERGRRTFDAVDLVERFAGIVEDLAASAARAA